MMDNSDDLPSAQRLLHAKARRVRRRLDARRKTRIGRVQPIRPFRVHGNRVERHYVRRHLRMTGVAPDWKHFTPYDVQWSYD